MVLQAAFAFSKKIREQNEVAAKKEEKIIKSHKATLTLQGRKPYVCGKHKALLQVFPQIRTLYSFASILANFKS